VLIRAIAILASSLRRDVFAPDSRSVASVAVAEVLHLPWTETDEARTMPSLPAGASLDTYSQRVVRRLQGRGCVALRAASRYLAERTRNDCPDAFDDKRIAAFGRRRDGHAG